MFSTKVIWSVLRRRQGCRLATSTGFLLAAALSLVSMAAVRGQEKPGSFGAKPTNHPPTVKILSPKSGSYEENAQVRYEIDVSDQEDGESKFQEINSTEVLLIVRHFSSLEAADAALNSTTRRRSAQSRHPKDIRLPQLPRLRRTFDRPFVCRYPQTLSVFASPCRQHEPAHPPRHIGGLGEHQDAQPS